MIECAPLVKEQRSTRHAGADLRCAYLLWAADLRRVQTHETVLVQGTLRRRGRCGRRRCHIMAMASVHEYVNMCQT